MTKLPKKEKNRAEATKYGLRKRTFNNLYFNNRSDLKIKLNKDQTTKSK